MPLLLKKPAFVGLSIHDDEIRLIKLRRIKRQLQIDDAAIIDLPVGLFIEGKITHLNQAISLISELVDKTQSQGCETAIALPIAQIMHKRISLAANLTEWERELEIAENLSRYLPAMQTELHYDHICLGKLDAKHDDVMLVTARSEQIKSYVLAVEQSGLHATVVDADIYALTRCFLYMREMECTAAVVDVDVNSLQVVIVQQKKVLFHQRSAVHSIEEAAESLLKTLKLCIDTWHFPPVEKIYLSGKSNLFQLQEMIRSCSSSCVEIFPLQNEFSWPEVQLKSVLFLTALGLAMRLLR